ncbi:GxxExxY protein [bacterium]|nr:GxxExxY protein [bacterium]
MNSESAVVRDALTEAVIGAAIEVHRTIGPGMLENAYNQCLCHELHLRQLAFQREVPLPLNYKGIRLDCGYRLDIVVEGRLVLELKAIDKVLPVHKQQLLSYLRMGGYNTGLLINFSAYKLVNGLTRLVL